MYTFGPMRRSPGITLSRRREPTRARSPSNQRGHPLLDSPLGKPNDPVGMLGDLLIVRDQHHSELALTVQVAEQLEHSLAAAGVQVPRRLVGQENRRPARQCPGDGLRAASRRRKAPTAR